MNLLGFNRDAVTRYVDKVCFVARYCGHDALLNDD